MMNKENVVRFKHHHLINKDILTVVTSLNHYTKTIRVGWSLFTFGGKPWKRKEANIIATRKMKETPLYIILSESEDIQTDYITLKALEVIYYHLIKYNTDCSLIFHIKNEIDITFSNLLNRARA